MFWKLGWIKNSLHYQIEKTLHPWRKKNSLSEVAKWNCLERLIFFCSNSPFISSFFIFIIMLSVSLLSSFFYPTIFKYLPEFSRNAWFKFENWDSVIITSSLTAIALIVPLALGFVGNTIKNNSSRDAFWNIYLSYAAPKFLATSTFFLVIFSLASQFINPFIEPKLRVALSVSIMMWMIINCFLMIWFFFATFKLVAAESRYKLAIRYCIHDGLIDELKYRLSRLIPRNALLSNIHPKFNSERNGQNSSKLTVSTSNLFNEHYVDFNCIYKQPRYISNIYFRTLSLGILLISYRLSFTNKIRGLFKKDIRTCQLSLPLTGSGPGTKEITFISYDGFKLNFIEKFIIKHSYKIKKGSGKNRSKFKPILSMLSGEVRDAIRENNYQQYSIALEALNTFTKNLINYSHFINEKGETINWLLLGIGSMFDRPLLWKLHTEYYELTNETLDILLKNNQYYDKIIKSQQSILGYRRPNIAYEIIYDSLLTHSRQWVQLLRWRSQYSKFENDTSLKNIYESSLRSYVASWETWLKFDTRIKNVKWTNAQLFCKFYADHLDNTACLLIKSIRSKELASSRWAADMLVRWIDNAYTSSAPYKFNWREHFLTLVDIGKDNNDSNLSFILNGESLKGTSEGEQDQYGDAIKIALLNYWCDVILLTAGYILKRPEDDFTTNAIPLALNLVDEIKQNPSGSRNRQKMRLNNGGDFIAAMLRQNWIEQYNSSQYSKRLYALIEQFNSLDETPKISGRVYTGWGRRGATGFEAGMKALFLYKVKGSFQLDKNTKSFILEKANFEHRIQIKNYLEKIKDADLKFLSKVLNFKSALKREVAFKKLIDNCINEIININTAEVDDAEIDEEREIELSKFASRDAFNKEVASFPINQFKDIEPTDKNLKNFKFAFTNYHKSDIAKGVSSQKASNEEDWLASTIDTNISFNVMGTFWENIREKKIHTYEDWADLLRGVKSALAKFSNTKTSIFIVSQSELSWYFDKLIWGYDKDIPFEEFNYRKEDNMVDSYICHFEGIEVHNGPITNIANILTLKEVFKTLKFKKNNDGYPVKAKYEPGKDPEKPNIGELVLTYEIKPVFGDNQVYLFKGPTEKED